MQLAGALWEGDSLSLEVPVLPRQRLPHVASPAPKGFQQVLLQGPEQALKAVDRS